MTVTRPDGNIGVVPLIHTIGIAGKVPDSVQVKVKASFSTVFVVSVLVNSIVGTTGKNRNYKYLYYNSTLINNIPTICRVANP